MLVDIRLHYFLDFPRAHDNEHINTRLGKNIRTIVRLNEIGKLFSAINIYRKKECVDLQDPKIKFIHELSHMENDFLEGKREALD